MVKYGFGFFGLIAIVWLIFIMDVANKQKQTTM